MVFANAAKKLRLYPSRKDVTSSAARSLNRIRKEKGTTAANYCNYCPDAEILDMADQQMVKVATEAGEEDLEAEVGFKEDGE